MDVGPIVIAAATVIAAVVAAGGAVHAAIISSRHRRETRDDHVDVRAKVDAFAAENSRDHERIAKSVERVVDRLEAHIDRDNS